MLLVPVEAEAGGKGDRVLVLFLLRSVGGAVAVAVVVSLVASRDDDGACCDSSDDWDVARADADLVKDDGGG